MYLVYMVPIQLLFSSCIFIDEQKNYVEVIPKPDLNNVAQLIYSYDEKKYFPLKDTLWVNKQLHVQLQEGIVFDSEVAINNKVVVPFGNKVRSFIIKNSDLPEVSNTIVLRQRVKSGTGSLADKAKVEYAEFQSQFIVMRDDNPPAVPKISSVAFQDGTVKIHWDEFKRSDFQYYKIIKSVQTIWGSMESRSFTIINQQQNSFIDSTYVGGPISYKLIINNGEDLASSIYPFYYEFKPMVTLTKKNASFEFTFTPPPFYKNVKYYKTSFYNGQIITTSNIDPSNLFMSIPGPVLFGPGAKYEINSVANVNNAGIGDQSTTTGRTTYGIKAKVYYGEAEHGISLPYYFCYLSSTGRMYKIDDSTFKVIDSLSYPGGKSSYNNYHMISASGKHHYYLTESAILKYDPNTLNVISSIPKSGINSPIGIDYYNPGNTVTNNNFIYFSGDDSGRFPCVVDMNTNTTVFISDNRSDPGHLSSDGLFLVIGSKVYKYNGSTYIFQNTLPYTDITYRQFIGSTPSQIFVATRSEIILYDCEAKTQLFSAPVEIYKIQLDQSSKKVTGFRRRDTAAFFGLDVFHIPTRTFKAVDVYPGYSRFTGDAFFTYYPVDSYCYILKDY